MRINLNEIRNNRKATLAVFIMLVAVALLFIILTFYHSIYGSRKIKATCGRSYYSQHGRGKRIANGNNVTDHRYPWMVIITSRTNECQNDVCQVSFCTGSLIDSNYVLTAAHCIINKKPSEYTVYVGALDFNFATLRPEQAYKVKKIVHHEAYSFDLPVSGQDDIALFKLERNVELSNKVSPICLPKYPKMDDISNKHVYVAGWGQMSNRTFYERLKETVLRIKSEKFCLNSSYLYKPNKFYCAKDDINLNEKISNVNKGDSGGPLFMQINNIWYIYGVTSFCLTNNFQDCDITKPSFFMKVPYYLKWIYDHID